MRRHLNGIGKLRAPNLAISLQHDSVVDRRERPKKHKTTGSNDLFGAPLDLIKLKHELVLLAGEIGREDRRPSRCSMA
jgi:hypothetical protein